MSTKPGDVTLTPIKTEVLSTHLKSSDSVTIRALPNVPVWNVTKPVKNIVLNDSAPDSILNKQMYCTDATGTISGVFVLKSRTAGEITIYSPDPITETKSLGLDFCFFFL